MRTQENLATRWFTPHQLQSLFNKKEGGSRPQASQLSPYTHPPFQVPAAGPHSRQTQGTLQRVSQSRPVESDTSRWLNTGNSKTQANPGGQYHQESTPAPLNGNSCVSPTPTQELPDHLPSPPSRPSARGPPESLPQPNTARRTAARATPVWSLTFAIPADVQTRGPAQATLPFLSQASTHPPLTSHWLF